MQEAQAVYDAEGLLGLTEKDILNIEKNKGYRYWIGYMRENQKAGIRDSSISSFETFGIVLYFPGTCRVWLHNGWFVLIFNWRMGPLLTL